MREFLSRRLKRKSSHLVSWEAVLGLGDIMKPITYDTKVNVSKYGPHPFVWTGEGLKDTSNNPWTVIEIVFPLLSQFIHNVGDGWDTYGEIPHRLGRRTKHSL